MRNPIRCFRARAASREDYCQRLRRSSAFPAIGLSIALLVAIGQAGCSDGETTLIDPAAAPIDPAAAPIDPAAAPASAARPERPEAGRTSPHAIVVEAPVVVFLGTSLTAGYGLEEDQAFPALIGERIESEGLPYRVINAGVSGDTSAGGLRRLDWLLRLPIAVLILELGANDMLRGQGVDALRANLEEILERTRAAHPRVRFVLAGMRAAPNLGPDYVAAFDSVYPDLAERFEVPLVPFLLEDVAAKRHLNQADGIHPTAEGHRLIADRVWQTLEPVLRAAPTD